jgi:hypothetical protein
MIQIRATAQQRVLAVCEVYAQGCEKPAENLWNQGKARFGGAEKRLNRPAKEPIEPSDAMEQMEANEPIEPMEQELPIEPIENELPIEPIEQNEPTEPIERALPTDFLERHELEPDVFVSPSPSTPGP